MKVKKQHSSNKMAIKAPNTVVAQPSNPSDDVHMILAAVEDNGFNWDSVSESTKMSATECKIVFDTLAKDAKKEEAIYVKEIKRTGGGPPPQPPNDDVHEKVKSLIGPSLEGLYTSYGGDFEFMQQQQELLPPEKQMDLLEQVAFQDQGTPNSVIGDPLSIISPITSKETNRATKSIMPKRLNLLKGKVDPSLDVQNKNKGTKKHASTSFVELAEDKKVLIQLKKQLAENQLLQQEELHHINMKIAKENLEFTRKKNEMELKFLKEKHELWKHENNISNSSETDA